MEEDIDIEEHDVLDNPRIRDIFPDLSRVKTEAPDSDLDDYEQPYEEYEQDQDERFEYEDYSDIDNMESDETFHLDAQVAHDDLPPDDIYHFNNKIILGSKPNTEMYESADSAVDFASDNVRKENLPAIVLLEDWKDKLNGSSCYCKECEILFATENALDAHKMIAHSFLVAISVNKAIKSTTKSAVGLFANAVKRLAGNNNVAKKSTGKSFDKDCNKFCNHCNKYFADGTSLIKHLYELLPSKNVNADVSHKKDADVEANFKCMVCNATFSNYNAASVHRKREHPAHERLHVITKVGKSAKRILVRDPVANAPRKVTVVKHKRVTVLNKIKRNKRARNLEKDSDHLHEYSGGDEIINPPVPKSVLYKCPLCDVHFVSIVPASHHTRCDQETTNSKCGICNRRIRNQDTRVHMLQHNFSNEFNVYDINRDLGSRLLCKCPKCGIHSTERKFWIHWKMGCAEPKDTCNVCDVELPMSSMKAHKHLHSLRKYTRNDFLLVEFVWGDSNKGEPECGAQHSDAKKIKLNHGAFKTVDQEILPLKQKYNKLLLNYCQLCKCCFHSKMWKTHLSSNCRKKKKYLCQLCGLMFTKSSIDSHSKFHKFLKVTLHDFKFFSKNSKSITPPPPDYHKCKKCRVHFLKPRGRHDCAENNKTCTVCNKVFSLNAYKLHAEFHIYANKTAPAEAKYDSLNKMWNILFNCKECNINTDSYDKSVEHSQKHFSNTERIDTRTEKCNICELKFDKSCFTVHQELHQKLPINRNDFLILIYDHSKLLTTDWFQLFGMLPQKKVQQILSASIYENTREIKLKLVQNGLPVTSVYKCKKCNTCVDPKKLSKHVHAIQNCKKLVKKRYDCHKCQLNFFSFVALKMHMSHHFENVPRDSFRIIELNNKFDISINSSLKFASSNEEINDSFENLPDTPQGNGNRKAVYKCARCKLDITTRCNAVQHKCTDEPKIRCKVCGLLYHIQRKVKHDLLHEKYPDLCQRNIKTIIFKPTRQLGKSKVDKEEHNNMESTLKIPKKLENGDVAKVYKCPCGLHFTSVKTIEKHIDVCTPEYKISKENCSKCGLLFDTDVLVSHLCKHHSKNKKIHLEVVKVVKIYECSECNLLFNNMHELFNHYDNCSTNCGEECEICGLLFHSSVVEKHKSMHTSENLGTILNKTIKVDKKDTIFDFKHVVHRCSLCDIHHMYSKSSHKHFKKGHVNCREIVPCSKCGLRFNTVSLPCHLKRDHSTRSFKIVVRDTITKKKYIVTEHSNSIANETISYSEEVAPRLVVYRCSRCDIQYIKLNSWRNHVKKNHRLTKTITCTLCGLKFHHKSLKSHWSRNHKEKELKIVVQEPDTQDSFIVTKYGELRNISGNVDTEGTNADALDDEESREDVAMATINHSEVPLAEDSVNDNTMDTEACDVETEMDVESPTGEINQDDITESTVYRCNICDIHNILEKSFYSHAFSRNHSFSRTVKSCQYCGLRFINQSLEKHLLLSHAKKCFRVTVIDLISNTTKVITNESIADLKNVDSHSAEVVESSDTVAMETEHNGNNCDDLGASSIDDVSVDETLAITTALEHDESITVSNSSVDSTETSESFRTEKEVELCSTPPIGYKIKLFKCGVCNVYYLTQAACYKHTQKHVPLNDIDYIECKKCSLQFTTTQIHIHMKRHHKNDFNLDEVLVEEYEPNVISNKAPKIDIYYVRDRIQSRLVSSTKVEAKNLLL